MSFAENSLLERHKLLKLKGFLRAEAGANQ